MIWGMYVSNSLGETSSGLPGSTTIGASGILRPLTTALANFSKRSLTSSNEGICHLRNSRLAWQLHAVQDPQLASPTIARSAVSAAFSSSPTGGAALVGKLTSLTD